MISYARIAPADKAVLPAAGTSQAPAGSQSAALNRSTDTPESSASCPPGATSGPVHCASNTGTIRREPTAPGTAGS